MPKKHCDFADYFIILGLKVLCVIYTFVGLCLAFYGVIGYRNFSWSL